MKKTLLFTLFFCWVNFTTLYAEQCYLEISEAGNYNPKVIAAFAVPLISQHFLPVETIPIFGINAKACIYNLNVAEDRTKTTISVSGKALNLIGESTLTGINGVKAALLNAVIAAKKSTVTEFCSTFPQLISEQCGINLSENPSAEEQETWELVKDTDAYKDLVDFVNLFPNGKYRYLANLKLMRLGQPPIEIDKSKNGTAEQEATLWAQVKSGGDFKTDELEYFLREFPKGKKKRIAQLMLKKRQRQQTKETSEKREWTTRIDQPHYKGFYYRQFSRRNGRNGKQETCTVYYRLFPDHTAISWFDDAYTCDGSIQPTDPKILEKVAQRLCKLEGCREDYDVPEFETLHTIEIDEFRWKIDQNKTLVFIHDDIRDIKNGEIMPPRTELLKVGTLYKPGIQQLKFDSGLPYNDPQRWLMLFVPFLKLKTATSPCNYKSFLLKGDQALDAYKKVAKNQFIYLTKVKRWYNSAIQCDPKQKISHFKMAQVLEIEGNLAWAAESYLDIFRLYPEDEAAILNMIRLYLQRGAFERAYQDSQIFLENNLNPSPSFFVEYARVSLLTCHCKEVEQAAFLANNSGNGSPLLDHYRGICALQEGDAEKGVNYLRKRSEKDGYQYTKRALNRLISIPRSVQKNATYKSWYGQLPTGKKQKSKRLKSCLNKRKP